MLSLVVLAAIVGSASAGLTPVEEIGPSGLFTFICDNGLSGVVESRPGTGTVFVQIGVRVGSRDEPRRLAGISHLLEHLLFKEGHGPGGAANPALGALREAGAIINGSTDFELTEFHADLPASRFEQGLEALVSRPIFPDEEIARERGVVLQEIAMGKTDPLAIAAYSVLRRLFPGDPIGQPVIGFRRTLKRVGSLDAEGERHPPYPDPAARLAADALRGREPLEPETRTVRTRAVTPASVRALAAPILAWSEPAVLALY